MDNFIVSARKYRPATFQSVVGQQHITGTLKNAIKNNQLAQAFLFCGPRGVGKTTCARILAKTINCQNLTEDYEACGVCDSCRSFQNGNSFNIHELDAASNNSVDDIRSLIEQVRIPPQAGKYKIYIIDEVHMLSQQAFNAFLKTLEEPPHYAIFILATTEKHKILPTILSRCQIFDFNRIRIEDMSSHLENIAIKEDIKFDKDGLHLIAQKADGGLRDALSMFDQIVSFSNKEVTYKAVIDNLNILDYDYYFSVTDAILNQNVPTALLLFDEILANGFDGNHFITGLASHFRNLLVSKDDVTLKLLEVSEGIRAKYQDQAKRMSPGALVSGLNIANQCDLNYKQSKNQRLQVELTLIKLCHMQSALNLSKQPLQAPTASDPEKKKPEQSVTNTQPPKTIDETPLSSNKPVEPSPITPPALPVEKPLAVANEPERESYKPKIDLSKNIAASISIPNLNDLAKPAAEEEKLEYITGESREPFTFEQFKPLWDSYAEKMRTNSKLNLFTIMTANPPVLTPENNIELVIENKIQENQLNAEKIDLLNFLRVSLKNFGIEIITRQPQKTDKKRLYTASEKYQHMAEKNPTLELFRKQFNLDIE